ncbi:hypothetical protein DDQ50_16315 [Amnibacterium flavum]|uniref:GntR C-terminal domain-containing protein n=1 Tax=Amnibacterium flavum TaxID=2173173 RepID=A0A2V1HKW9_9MICO|nr:hypothetical protein DDQ50_16315 [Amnibacterium flavum]
MPVLALGNHAVESVLDHLGPLVRRAERQHFSRDGTSSVAMHNQLIELLARGDADQASIVAFDI